MCCTNVFVRRFSSIDGIVPVYLFIFAGPELGTGILRGFSRPLVRTNGESRPDNYSPHFEYRYGALVIGEISKNSVFRMGVCVCES